MELMISWIETLSSYANRINLRPRPVPSLPLTLGHLRLARYIHSSSHYYLSILPNSERLKFVLSSGLLSVSLALMDTLTRQIGKIIITSVGHNLPKRQILPV